METSHDLAAGWLFLPPVDAQAVFDHHDFVTILLLFLVQNKFMVLTQF